MTRRGYLFSPRRKKIQQGVIVRPTARLTARIKQANKKARQEMTREQRYQLRFSRIADSLTLFLQDARKRWPGAILAAFDDELSLIWGLEQGEPMEIFRVLIPTLQGGQGVRVPPKTRKLRPLRERDENDQVVKRKANGGDTREEIPDADQDPYPMDL